MKQLNQYIQEKLQISSTSKVYSGNAPIENEFSFNEFKMLLKVKFNLKQSEVDHMIDSFSTDINNIHKYKFKERKYNKDRYKDKALHNWGAELVNHPNSYQKMYNFSRIYINRSIDLYVYLYINFSLSGKENELYIYMIDEKSNTFSIYQLIK